MVVSVHTPRNIGPRQNSPHRIFSARKRVTPLYVRIGNDCPCERFQPTRRAMHTCVLLESPHAVNSRGRGIECGTLSCHILYIVSLSLALKNREIVSADS